MKILNEYKNKVFELFFKLKINSLIKKDFDPNEYKYFKNSKEIKKWGGKFNLYFEDKRKLKNSVLASEDDLQELELLDYYAGYGSEIINKYLRGIQQYLIDEKDIENKSTNLEKIIGKFNLTENLISIRLMPSKFINKDYKKGKIFIEKGFLSTSLNLTYRMDYQGSKIILKNQALLIIKIPKGTNAIYTEEVQPKSRQREEYELIIQKNQKIRIESNQKIFSNRIIVVSIEKANV